MANHNSKKIKKQLDSVAIASKHLNNYGTEMRKRIEKALQVREMFKKDFPKQIVQLV